MPQRSKEQMLFKKMMNHNYFHLNKMNNKMMRTLVKTMKVNMVLILKKDQLRERKEEHLSVPMMR